MKITILTNSIRLKGLYISALIAFIALYPYQPGYSQQHDIDSLKKVLQNYPGTDTNRVITLNKLSLSYYNTKLSYLRLYGSEALKLATQLNYPRGQAFAYKNLGLGYLADNANPTALDYFNKSLGIFISLRERLNSAKVLNNMGYYYGVIKDHHQELNYLLQAYDEAKFSNDQTAKSTILGNIGNAYEAIGQFSKAKDYYTKALDLAVKYKISNGIVAAYSNLASVFLKEEKYELAMDYCNQVLAIHNTSDNFKPRDLANIYILQGKIYYKLRQYDKARKVFDQSLAIATNLGNAEYLSQNYYNMYLLDSVKGDYESALKNYSQYTRLDDSLINVNKNQLVALYQIKFDSQKRIAENQRLKIEEERSEAIINQQHTIEVVLIIGFIIIFVGAVYLFRINNQVNDKNKIINEQNQVLENNNLVKDKLFSVISHDLRSPITQVVGLLNLWEAGEMNHQEMSVLTPTVKSSIMHTLELLDNLLIWSKNQLQGFNFNPLAFDLRGLTEENLKNLDSIVDKKDISIENDIEPDTIVHADMEMIKIVLRNLISNAIKFTPDNGTIRISSYTKDGQIVICVEDTGIGIKEKDQAKIFSFTSHTTLGTANEKGTGIGLKICRDFIELNKGRIWMESKENIGSKFYVSLPLEAQTILKAREVLV
ncbi:MAG: tetratricopeptide repeat-containing sensor histidine kinase [Mucilaginibacter sp.]|uniref:tetratricopeptide repeat-containing sensor histidine kinase n=1 Tax=Mucilaginibacter sp. TaxID=1882438 RepID=UPI003263BE73